MKICPCPSLGSLHYITCTPFHYIMHIAHVHTMMVAKVFVDTMAKGDECFIGQFVHLVNNIIPNKFLKNHS
jgi:hypothetical protein